MSGTIQELVKGREADIMQALVSSNLLDGKRHRCPYPDGRHRNGDKNPSWRWDASKRRWYCSCAAHNGGDAFDAIKRTLGLDVAGATRWLREQFNLPLQASDHVRFFLPADTAMQAERARQVQEAAEREHSLRQAAREGMARLAGHIWRQAPLANTAHPYLHAKGISRPYGGIREAGADLLRVGGYNLIAHLKGDLSQTALVIPQYDLPGKLQALQFIYADSSKQFLKGSEVAHLCLMLEEPDDSLEELVLCEGYATGVKIREAVGLPTIACFSASNLINIATGVRDADPNKRIIIAADNDPKGLEKAKKAAEATGAELAIPDFGPDRRERETDFCDLAARFGLLRVARQILGE